jgi:hypothetical protein
MRIGIIGTGHVGGTLAKHLASVGHDVAIANSRGPETLTGLESELGEHGHAMTAERAAAYGDVVIVSIPFGHIRELPVAPTAGKTVIDANNYYPDRDGHVTELDDDRTTSSELLQDHLPQATVVKAFNTMIWKHLRDFARPAGEAQRYGLPLSGDDPQAKRTVARLIDEIGFAPVDAGTLAEGGRRQQPGSPVYIADLREDDLRAALEQEPREEDGFARKGDWTDEAVKARTSSDPRARTPHDRRGIPSTGG